MKSTGGAPASGHDRPLVKGRVWDSSFDELGKAALKRVFEIDLEHCSNCSGALKIIAATLETAVIMLGVARHYYRGERYLISPCLRSPVWAEAG